MPEGQREELRLALVMNGGVSLAVWMGGVTNEIYRLVRRSHPVYDALLTLTHTVAKVDVISGTSAGGINGAALALALTYESDFSSLRDVWLSSGAFEALLRTPLGPNTGSLLMGEDYFLPALEAAFTNLVDNKCRPVAQPGDTPLDLRLTTTLLTGRQGHAVDDLGEPLNDVDYRAHFKFKYRVGDTTDFDDPKRLIPALARAARSTSSFPFAFEPSAVPGDLSAGCLKDAMGRALTQRVPNLAGPTNAVAAACAADRVPAAPQSKIYKRHVIDGGVLDNKPIRGALSAIFAMPREGSVRRVLAYINPDPGDGPPADLEAETPMPELGTVIAASILGIPQSQTISDQLNEITRHNRRVRTRRDTILDIVHSLSWDDSASLAQKLFGVYHERRLADAFEIFVYDNLRAAATRCPQLAPALSAFSKHNRESLRALFTTLSWEKWLPKAWPAPQQQAHAHSFTEWQWGLFPVEFAITVLMEFLRRTQALIVVKDGLASVLPSQQATASASTAAPTSSDRYDWSDDFADRHTLDPTPQTDDDKALLALWKDAYSLINKVNDLRKMDAGRWAENSTRLLSAWMPAGTRVAADIGQDFENMFAFLGETDRRTKCAEYVYAAAACISQLGVLANSVLATVPDTALSYADGKLKRNVADLVRFLCGKDASQSEIVYRLLQLEVIQYAFTSRDEMNEDALIEMVQISGNAKSPLSNHAYAKEKLSGLQVAHFGAFYKESWRANDWIYGRLDCSMRLINVLLNPERLRRFYSNPPAGATLPATAAQVSNAADGVSDAGPCAAYVASEIRRIALLDVKSAVLQAELAKAWSEDQLWDGMTSELAFLDDKNLPLPDALPACAVALTLRLHYGILRQELPVLKGAIIKDQSVGAEAFGPGAALLRILSRNQHPSAQHVRQRTAAQEGLLDDTSGIFTPEEARKALQDGLIAAEKLKDEASSDLFLRTITHCLIAIQSTLARPGLGPITAFFAWVRLPTMGLFFVTRGLTHQSRSSAALNGGMLSLGVFILLLQFFWHPIGTEPENNLPHLVVVFGWAFFAYGLFMTIIRAPRLTAGVLIAASAGIAAYHDMRTPGIALLLVLTVLMVLSIWSVWLQFVMGMVFIVLVGLWGGMPETILPACSWVLFHASPIIAQCNWLRLSQPAVVLSIAVALTLGLAILQAMQWPRLLRYKLALSIKRAKQQHARHR